LHEVRASPPEAATELEHGHARPQLELARDQLQFAALRLVERQICTVGAVVGAGVLHGRTEHRDIEVVREITVAPRDTPRKRSPLRIADPAEHDLPEHRGGHEPAFEPRLVDAREELVEARDIPPAIHVGLAGTEASMRQHASIEALVVHADIPRIAAIDLDVCGQQQGRQLVLRCHRCDPIDHATAMPVPFTYCCDGGLQPVPELY
jgi:hypothetical protein